MPQQPRLRQRRDQTAHGAGNVGVGVRPEHGRQLLRRPTLESRGDGAVPGGEERPVEEAAVGHQLPSKTGFCLATKAR